MSVLEKRACKNITKPMPIQWLMIVDLMPQYDWKPTTAAKHLPLKPDGTKYYSDRYVANQLAAMLNRDDRFTKAVEAKRVEIERKSGWDIDKWVKEATDYYDTCKADGYSQGIEFCLDRFGKHVGSFERDNSQRRNQIGMVIL